MRLMSDFQTIAQLFFTHLPSQAQNLFYKNNHPNTYDNTVYTVYMPHSTYIVRTTKQNSR